MYIPGLVSVSFRKLSPDTLIDACVRSGLLAIEWGGDIHVPHGDVATARAVGEATRNAGLTVAAYGSYYRCDPTADQPDFAAVLASAQALGAPLIRVWAGTAASAEATGDDRSRIAEDLRRIGEIAAKAGIQICIEYHANTLTDDPDSAARLIEAVDHPNVKLYWQTSNGKSSDYSADVLRRLLPHVTHLHVFHWDFKDGEIDRRPLAEAVREWNTFLHIATPNPPMQRCLLLEFVRDDSLDQLEGDALTLNALIARHQQELGTQQ
ncbi:MAG: sugar phosphate isomerase/epimerase [Synoicihabitans sp.]